MLDACEEYSQGAQQAAEFSAQVQRRIDRHLFFEPSVTTIMCRIAVGQTDNTVDVEIEFNNGPEIRLYRRC